MAFKIVMKPRIYYVKELNLWFIKYSEDDICAFHTSFKDALKCFRHWLKYKRGEI